jgi:hypothetical protein
LFATRRLRFRKKKKKKNDRGDRGAPRHPSGWPRAGLKATLLGEILRVSWTESVTIERWKYRCPTPFNHSAMIRALTSRRKGAMARAKLCHIIYTTEIMVVLSSLPSIQRDCDCDTYFSLVDMGGSMSMWIRRHPPPFFTPRCA